MEKTIKINLAGILFHIDEEAYLILRDYLQAINVKFRNIPGGNETIEDIELRIAEIFQSQKGQAGVISRTNIEDMISILGKPEDFLPPDYEETSPGPASFSQRKRMFRNSDDRIIGGVCGGIGAYLNTDPVWLRILFVVFALMFGFGIFVYLALWIALPAAVTELQKKEMHYPVNDSLTPDKSQSVQSFTTASRAGNAVNEVFRAMGKVFYIIVRIFLIILGVSLVLAGFLALLSFIMVFIFKFPGAFSTNIAGINLSYMPDFLNYLVTPQFVPWIKALIIITVTLPLVALIYGGIRLIFWFRARDGFLWLAFLIVWVLSTAALSIIMFNEGISFVETAETTSRDYFSSVPDTLYILSGKKVSDLHYDNEISLPDEYYIYFSDEKEELYIRTFLDIYPSEDRSAGLDIKKRSWGRSRSDARAKTDRLLYDFRITGDTIFIDEFCTIPAGTKWSFDEVSLQLFAPEGTVIYMDQTTERQFHGLNDNDFVSGHGSRFWRMTEWGPDHIESGLREK